MSLNRSGSRFGEASQIEEALLALDSLALISDFDSLSGLSQYHSSSILLRGYCSLFRLVFDECYSLATGDGSRLPEPFEAAEDGDQRIHVVRFGKILHEKDLIWRQVLVGDHGGSGGVGGLEASTTGWFRRTGGHILGSTRFESFLFLKSLSSSSFICGPDTPRSVSLHPSPRKVHELLKEGGVERRGGGERGGPTLFGESSPFVLLILLIISKRLHGSIASGPGHCQAHRFLEDVKPL